MAAVQLPCLASRWLSSITFAKEAAARAFDSCAPCSQNAKHWLCFAIEQQHEWAGVGQSQEEQCTLNTKQGVLPSMLVLKHADPTLEALLR